MRWPECLDTLGRRARRPLLGAVAGLLVLLDWGVQLLGHWLSRNVLHSPHPQSLRASALLMGLLGPLLLMWVSPMAWQWSGDDRRACPAGRALLQSLALWVPWYALGLLEGWPALQAASAKVPHPSYLPVILGAGFLWGFGIHALVGYAIAGWEGRVALREAALEQARVAQWNLLRGQMSPHVLLNSLGGLAELVREDPALGLKGMRDLSEIYRQLLDMGERPLVPLASERSLLERYLAVEQLRLGESLRVEWVWEEGLDARMVIPLLLQPLVENALKHGVAASPQGGRLRVAARETPEGVRLEVRNTGAPLGGEGGRGTGVGLRNLEARLHLAYGEGARFGLRAEGEWTLAEIRLPGGSP